jgi:RNA polymerase sigma-70 factor (ECF subfamily)
MSTARTVTNDVYDELYEANRRLLWGLGYRMTGDAAEAEDIVQETFVRALASPPRDTSEPWRPWLVRVALNIARDRLRRRRRDYTGPWLPTPIVDDGRLDEDRSSTEDSPEARYDLVESISFAFLVALEALTPARRAVLLLRDVFDYSTSETAAALAMTKANVKVSLHRARTAMRGYEGAHVTLEDRGDARTREALGRFLACLQGRDVEGLERLLAEGVVAVADGGGEVVALRAPVAGVDAVVVLVTRIYERFAGATRVFGCRLNGQPAVLVERDGVPEGHAARFTVHCDVDRAGRISRLNFVFAPSKLLALDRATGG